MTIDWRATYDTQLLDVWAPWGPAQHLKIWRHDGEPITCDWSTIQQIKDDRLGPGAVAVEFYPSADQVVDEINYRHLWTVDLEPPMRPQEGLIWTS